MQYLTDFILDENLELEPETLFEVVCEYLQYQPQEFKKALPDPKYDYIDFRANWGDKRTIQIWATQINVTSKEAYPPEIVGAIQLKRLVGHKYRVTLSFGQPTIVWDGDDKSGKLFTITNNPREVQALRNKGFNGQTFDTQKILELVFFYLGEYIIHVFKGERAVDEWKQWLDELKSVDIELPYRRSQQLETAELERLGEKPPKLPEPQQLTPPPPSTAGLIEGYDLRKIRTLLNEISSEGELRDFCLDEPDFRLVLDELKDSDRKPEILRRLLDHARRKGLVPRLLDWARATNALRYAMGEPYES